MNERAEVTIIGGGIVGSASAYYLAKRGINVVLVERGGLASGTSGACQGGVPAQLVEPPILLYILESQKLYLHLKEQGLMYEYDQTGSLICLTQEKQRSIMKSHANMLRSNGLEIKEYTTDELQEIEPAIGDNVLGGSFLAKDFITNPFKVTHELCFAAEELGAKLYQYNEVKAIEVINGEINEVKTTKGSIRTSCIVNAAGVWSSDIAKMVGYDLPVIPQRGQLIVTEPVQRYNFRYLLDADYLTTAHDPESVKKSKDPRIKLGVASVLSQAMTGNWIIGSSRDLAGFNRNNTQETLEWLVKRAITFIPNLGKYHCIRTFAGLRPITKDNMPILGNIEEINDFIIATALHGEGITLGPLWGKLISELVEFRKTSMPIKLFDPARFH